MTTSFSPTLRASLLLGALALPAHLFAQEYATKFSSRQDRKVVLELDGDVTIEGYDGDELVIRGDGYEPPPKRADGLRAVYNSAIDNTKLGLAVESGVNNTIRVVKASRREVNYVVRVPRQTNVAYTQPNWIGGGKVIVRGISGNVEATTKNSELDLTNLTGAVVVSSTSGDVTISLPSLRAGAENAISLVSGNLDVTLPASAKANLKMRSVTGEIYTDFDLVMAQKADHLHRVGGQTVEGTIGGGGPAFSLNTISGDIYLRKAK